MDNEFNIDNFIVSSYQELSTSDNRNKPEWLSGKSDLIKKIYDEVILEEYKIIGKINKGEVVSIKDRSITKSKIAKLCGVDRSYISNRRMPEIVKLIDARQDYINYIWKSKSSKKGVRDLSKKNLMSEVVRLKRELREEKDRNYSDIFTKILNSDMSNDHVRLVKQISELKCRNNEYLETISRLRLQLRSGIKLTS